MIAKVGIIKVATNVEVVSGVAMEASNAWNAPEQIGCSFIHTHCTIRYLK
jgi:hypothetical protein